MQLNDYFDREQFPTGERIRIKGTRIAIEDILGPYLAGDSPERIAHNFRHVLTLEQVYATLTYYWHDKDTIETYLTLARAAEETAYREYSNREPPEVVRRMRELAAERDKPRARSG